jgi:hypothetical protein
MAHVLETGLPKRTTQRVVIHQPSLTELGTFFATGNPDLDTEDGHDIAYRRILSACSLYENPPVFFPADSKDFGGLDISEKVSLWMHTAAQVSTGGRKQVLEDGRDVCNSESDSENEDHGEELTGMYTADIPLDSQGRPVDSRYKLSESQANALRAQAVESSRPTTQASTAGSSEPITHSPLKGKSASAGHDQEVLSKKAAPKAPAQEEHPIKTRSKVKGQESPAPVVTEESASGAGGLRPVQGKRVRVRQKVALPKPES